MAYNFVHDFLSSFTEDDMSFDQKMLDTIYSVRKNLQSTYTIEELYSVLLKPGSESTVRRQQDPVLQKSFKERVQSW